jgi:hypothetical protein
MHVPGSEMRGSRCRFLTMRGKNFSGFQLCFTMAPEALSKSIQTTKVKGRFARDDKMLGASRRGLPEFVRLGKMGGILKNLGVLLLLAVAALAQNSTPPGPASAAKGQPASANAQAVPDLASQVPPPKAEDVKSMDGLLGAIYDVISGPAGDRDWARFRSLFVPQARFTQTSKAPDGSVVVNLLGVDDFVMVAGDAFKKEPFYENAIVNRAQTYGNVTQVFSSYESRRAPGEKPFQRGINSIQLINDGKRWWVLSILWDEERPDNPLPPEFASASRKTLQ